MTNEEIKQFIIENPIYLNGSYALGAEKVGVTYEKFRHICRKIRKENVPTTPKIEAKSIDLSNCTPSGIGLNAEGIKSYIRDTWDEFDVVRHVTKDIKRIAIISDLHGVFLDKKVFNCFLEVIKDNQFDEIVLNGDVLDFPLLSRHTGKLINSGYMKDYSEIKEIEFAKEHILKAIRNASQANIVMRLGNHSERVTAPFNLSQSQLARLAVLYHHYGTVKLDEMLELKSMDIEFDPTPVRSYYGVFDVIHGLSLAKNAQENNIMSRMKSGASSHSHRMGAKYITKADKEYVWIETGCMRVRKNIEYFPTAVTADWAHGFAVINFDLNKDKVKFFGGCYPIIDGATCYNGNVYYGN